MNDRLTSRAHWPSPAAPGSVMLGVDVGGSHVVAAAVDVHKGVILEHSERRVNVDANAPADHVLDAWCGTCQAALRSAGERSLAGIGVAMPGPFDYEKGVCLMRGVGKYEALHGMNIRTEMKRRLGLKPEARVIFRNDAICFLLGEAWLGAAADCRDVICLTLGTGFGSAFLRGGHVAETDPGLPPGGWLYNQPCCDGIADDWFSTRGLLRMYFEAGGTQPITVRELSERAAWGDPFSRRVLAEFGSRLADFLDPHVGKFRPECLVVGGNIAKAWDWLSPTLVEKLAATQPCVAVRKSALFEHAALLGGATLPLRYAEQPDAD